MFTSTWTSYSPQATKAESRVADLRLRLEATEGELSKERAGATSKVKVICPRGASVSDWDVQGMADRN